MRIEQEANKYIMIYKCTKIVEKCKQYFEDLETVDIPEFAKLKEDKQDTMIDNYICSILKAGKLDEIYNKL